MQENTHMHNININKYFKKIHQFTVVHYEANHYLLQIKSYDIGIFDELIFSSSSEDTYPYLRQAWYLWKFGLL